MTKEETLKILAVLEVAYPRFYVNVDKTLVFKLWHNSFVECPYKIVNYALNETIKTCKFPPTIADIWEHIINMKSIGEKTPSDYWLEVLKAVDAGQYRAAESFNNLSAPVQRYFGSPNGIRELCISEADKLNTVSKGIFLKQIAVIAEREALSKTIPTDIKNLLDETSNKLCISKNNEQ